MIVSGWGRYPKIDCRVSSPQTRGEIQQLLGKGCGIARGGGRAYGDSAISAENTIEMRWLNQFLDFDAASGVLSVKAGVQLRDIIETFLPRGWFLPVTPGTSFVTVGGAIASDVHGKNHHLVGTFCQHLCEIELMLGNGQVVTASPADHSELFHATCGGMGLTGIILSARIQLVRVYSGLIRQKSLKAKNLDELFEKFEVNSGSTYSVAWVDCLATDAELGRSVLLLGEHAQNGEMTAAIEQRFSVPIDAPSFLLNRWSVRAFNSLYYSKYSHEVESVIGLYDYFYPLDKIGSWNRLYGSMGFVQYQFAIPKDGGLENMRHILTRISDSGEGSFLAVIKLFGSQNSNLMSFPFSGYTLALDFKVNVKTFALLTSLDDMISEMGGRIYLTKDARMASDKFKRMYPRWEEFETMREKYGAVGKLSSAQSVRLGLK